MHACTHTNHAIAYEHVSICCTLLLYRTMRANVRTIFTTGRKSAIGYRNEDKQLSHSIHEGLDLYQIKHARRRSIDIILMYVNAMCGLMLAMT